jgi:hypothetical protein
MKRFINVDNYRPLLEWGDRVEQQHLRPRNIKPVGYGQTSIILGIEFDNGRTYQYFDVLSQLYLSLIEAASKGEYFHNIKKFRFKFEHSLKED